VNKAAAELQVQHNSQSAFCFMLFKYNCYSSAAREQTKPRA